MTDLRISGPSFSDPGERATVPGRNPGALPPIVREAPPAASPAVALAIGFAMGRERIQRRPTALAAMILERQRWSWSRGRSRGARGPPGAVASPWGHVQPGGPARHLRRVRRGERAV